MATIPNDPPNDPPCSTIVYRLILKSGWVDPEDTTKMKSEAFMRRPQIDCDGLSVFDSYRITQEDCVQTVNRCYGIATLHVGTLLNHGLNVIRDPEDHRKILITNMPFENPGDANAERLCEIIAESARIAMRCRHKQKN